MRPLLVAAVLGLAAVAIAAAGGGPGAHFKASPRSPRVGQQTWLDASASKCKRCRYQWRAIWRGRAYKLGRQSKGKVLRYRFRSAGMKRVRLTVIDQRGHRAQRTHRIMVRPAARTTRRGARSAPTRKGCFANPSACGYPDADNTGPTGSLQSVPGASLPSGAAWDSGTQTLRITGDDVTIQNLDIAGPVAVDGDRATVRNSRIHLSSGCSTPCGSYGIRLGQTDATVTGTVLQALDIVTEEKDPGNDNPLDPATIDTKLDHGVRNNGDNAVTADHLYVKGFAGAWKGPGTIENSYLFSQLVFDGDHVEAYLNGGEGNPTILDHDTILNPVAQTAAISLFNDFGGIGRVEVVDNLLAGGGYVMYGGAKNGSANVTGPVIVRGNRIARGRDKTHGYYSRGGQLGLWAEFDKSATTACGNYWDDTLSPTGSPDSTRC
jgi:hypothetical protein